MKIIKIILTAILLCSYISEAQVMNSENNSISFGLALNNSWNKINFKQLSEIENCCPDIFDNSSSQNILGEVSFRKFIFNDFAYFVNLGFINYSDKFTSTESKITEDDFAKIRHTMELNFFNIQNRIGLSNKFNHLGIAYGLINEFVISKKYDQKEELIEPKGATFENDLTVRNVYKNKDASYINNYNLGVFGQVWYEFYFDEYHLRAISPYIEFNYFLTDYHKYNDFKKMNLVVGIQFRLIYKKDNDTPLSPID